MVRHIVLWNFLETLSEEEKASAGRKIQENLMPLKEEIPGVLALEVRINKLDSSNRDIALIGDYESVEALQQYAVHPKHVAAGDYIKTVTCSRTCFDYEI